jgi:ubiquinone/menaquinone biosynthesis C-methylase UbiE
MAESKKPIDWSEKCWKDMLIYQRKALWREDTLDKLAAWMDLRPGMTAVDIGCGLGYLGYAFWKYFGKGGHYIGVDINQPNLTDAANAAREWASGGKAEFLSGSGYEIPLADNTADLVMCQVVLIHLENPEEIVEEMIRVAKPGGLIVCSEPDNMSSPMIKYCTSVPDMSVEEKLLAAKVYLLSNQGRMEQGRGDDSLGSQIPHMMKNLGLVDIDIRQNDKVHHLEPPYEGFIQQATLEKMKKHWWDDKARDIWVERERSEFIDGGGTAEEYDEYLEMGKKRLEICKGQVERGEYYACGGALMYIIKGRKPESWSKPKLT